MNEKKNKLFTKATRDIAENQDKPAKSGMIPTTGMSFRCPYSFPAIMGRVDNICLTRGERLATKDIIVAACLYYYYGVVENASAEDIIAMNRKLCEAVATFRPDQIQEDLAQFRGTFDKLCKEHTGK